VSDIDCNLALLVMAMYCDSPILHDLVAINDTYVNSTAKWWFEFNPETLMIMRIVTGRIQTSEKT